MIITIVITASDDLDRKIVREAIADSLTSNVLYEDFDSVSVGIQND